MAFIRTVGRGLAWVFVGLVLLWALSYHALRLSFPYQWEPTEGGLMMSAVALQAHQDPWSPQLAQLYSNNYGIGYPWVIARLKDRLPDLPWLKLMHLTSAACLWLALGLLALELRDLGGEVLPILGGLTAIYAILLIFDTASGKPDALALVVYLAALAAARRPGPLPAGLAGSLAALGYFIKPYALLAAPVAIFALALQSRWKDAGVLALAALACGALLSAAVLRGHPYYFYGTLYTLAQATQYDVAYLFTQFRDVLYYNLFAVVAAVLVLGRSMRLGLPLRPLAGAGFWAACSLAVMLALWAGPGAHLGAYLRYYDELWLPVAIGALVLWAGQAHFPAALLAVLLAANAAFILHASVIDPKPVSEADLHEWTRVEAWIRSHPNGCYPPFFTTLAFDLKARIVDTDHSRYLVLARSQAAPTPLSEEALVQLHRLGDDLQHGAFDTVVCGGPWRCPVGLESWGYRQVDTFKLRTPLSGLMDFKVYVPSHLHPPKKGSS